MVNVVTIAAYRQINWLRLIGLVQMSAAAWRSVLHSSDELCHDDGIINTGIVIIIKLSSVSVYHNSISVT